MHACQEALSVAWCGVYGGLGIPILSRTTLRLETLAVLIGTGPGPSQAGERTYVCAVCSMAVESARSDLRNVELMVDFFFTSAEGGNIARTIADLDCESTRASSGERKPRFLSSHPSAVYRTGC